ncbi:hypothetical protein E2542_SST07713 [Spatholobus suberectus]|nr:hypothetical protein E2542_SST07713 [Spatholobus suberectus]
MKLMTVINILYSIPYPVNWFSPQQKQIVYHFRLWQSTHPRDDHKEQEENRMAVFLGIITLMRSPFVDIPSDSGVTSNSTKLGTYLLPLLNKAAWTAAPYATASSGLMLMHRSFPLKKSCNSCCTLGILEEPPTNQAFKANSSMMLIKVELRNNI